MSTDFMTDDVLAAVVTGNHPYDVLGFQRMLRALAGIDAYVQHIEDFVADAGNVRVLYDAVLFYHFAQTTPDTSEHPLAARARDAIEELGDTGQGIVVLHHALLAHPDWEIWSEVCGVSDRHFTYHEGQSLRVEVADAEHPITAGLEPWEMVDETYAMAEPDADSHILLATQHPDSMRALAWTRRFRDARVLCCALGHDSRAYRDPRFRSVLQRGLWWVAGRL